jgi:hypothetical protein
MADNSRTVSVKSLDEGIGFFERYRYEFEFPVRLITKSGIIAREHGGSFRLQQSPSII